MIYTSEKHIIYLTENKLSRQLYACNTTLIEKNYMNLTYYSKKCKFNLCTPFEVIVNISKFRKETKQRIFQLQRLIGRKAEDRYTTVGFKEIIED